MAFHITVVSAKGEPAIEEEDLFLYAGYFIEVSGKNIRFNPHFYEVKTRSGLQVRHIVLQEVTHSSEDVVFVVTDLPLDNSGGIDQLLQRRLSIVVKEMILRCEDPHVAIDGPFGVDPEDAVRRPAIGSQVAYRFVNAAKAITNDIARGQRSRFQLLKSDEDEG